MKIYRVKDDGWKYKEFRLDIQDLYGMLESRADRLKLLNLSSENFSLKKIWKTTQAEFKEAEGMADSPIPDICTWFDASLVLSEKAFAHLEPLLKNFGEFLDVKVGTEKYFIFNCLTFNSADSDDKTVFKTKFNRGSCLFCTDALKDAVESNELSGLTFSENLTSLV